MAEEDAVDVKPPATRDGAPLEGGKDSEENLQLLCLFCNRRKYNKVTNGIFEDTELGPVADI